MQRFRNRSTNRQLAVVIFTIVATSLSANGQENPVQPGQQNGAARILQDSDAPNREINVETLPATASDLVAELENLRLEMPDETGSTPDGVTSDLLDPSLLQRINSSESESALEFHELKTRIRRILTEQRRRAAAADAMQQLDHPIPESPAQNSRTVAADPVDELDPVLVQQIEADPVMENAESKTSPVEPKLTTVSSRKILATPPDKLQLANNLYASGEIELATELFGQVRRMSHNVDEQLWLDFQIASGLRRLGKNDAARKLLREIAGREDSETITRSARWWLDTIDKREEIESARDMMQQYLSLPGGQP